MSKQLPRFSQEFMNFRKQHKLSLQKVATTTGLSVSFLSYLEMGKRCASKEFIESLAKHYSYFRDRQEEMEFYADCSRPFIHISTKDLTDKQTECLVRYSNAVSNLSPEQVQKIEQILGEKNVA